MKYQITFTNVLPEMCVNIKNECNAHYGFVKPFNFNSLTRLWDYRILHCLYSHINILNLKIKKFEKN